MNKIEQKIFDLISRYFERIHTFADCKIIQSIEMDEIRVGFIL